MKHNRYFLLFAILTCLWHRPLSAQNNEPLSNATVIELHKLGLGEAVITEKLKSSRGSFDVSLDGLKQLKSAGVSDEVIRVMIATTSAGQVSGGQVATGDPNDPKSPHEAGIWFFEEKEGKSKMVMLEPSVYSQVKSGIALFAAYGQTAKSEAVLRSAHAVIQTENRKPIFYFYFEKSQSGLSDPTRSLTSANEFLLAQFRTDEKNSLRKLVVGQFNAYTGGQTGPEDKSVRSFNFEKVTPGIFKVTPKEELGTGEYGFFYAGSATLGPFVAASGGGGRIFDFSVKGSPDTEPQKTGTSKSKARQGSK